ncbi:hypothetical protein B0O80DRAFT_135502 [Mortierella sp. GBAus27b]|nr:hypothetical protein B0O80DRAFT_135502 [Mortierella sp. GBAus27b]
MWESIHQPQRRGWDKIELYFNGEVSDPVIESLIDVAALRTALNKSHTADLDNTAATLAPSAATLAPEATTNSSRSTRTPSSRSRYGSSGNLTPAQITTMRTTFNNNFSKFNGDPWLLSSGTVFDDCLRGVVEGLSLESALHSFIIEDMDPILHLFENTADQEEIKRVTSRGGSLPELSSAQSSFLMQYNMAPADLEEYLSTHGWRNVGEDKPSDNFRKVAHACVTHVLQANERTKWPSPRLLESHGLTPICGGFFASPCRVPGLWSSNRVKSLPMRRTGDVTNREPGTFVNTLATKLMEWWWWQLDLLRSTILSMIPQR